jgi:ABC-type lipoprotein release transport system permease subunit
MALTVIATLSLCIGANTAIFSTVDTAAALAHLMASLVFGITPRDPLSFAAAPVVLAIVAAAASILPARRASTVDPMAALRDD